MSDIHHVNLAALDLNLLVVFDALMTEQHVTRAAQRIGLSQPATSNALARLRSLLKDDLFVRTSQGLRPTATAIALQQHLRPALQQIQAALLEQSTFEPITSDRAFGIGMSDYVEFVLLPPLMQAIEKLAPHVVMQVRSGDREKLLALLDSGEIDIACGVFPETMKGHHQQPLFQESYTCVCRQSHPAIGDSLSLDTYLAVSHLLVSVMEDRTGRVDKLLSRQNCSRHIALSIPHFLVAPFVLAETDLIATLAHRVARAFARHQSLKLLPMPLEMDDFTVSMHWHQATEKSPACQWMRSLIAEISQQI